MSSSSTLCNLFPLSLIMFQYFYKNLRGQSRFQATYSIKEHVKRTCKRVLNEEKDRLKKKMAETGLPTTDLRPSYFHPILWEQLLKYWESKGHKHRSDVGAKNRKKVLTLHSAGAKSFEAVEIVKLLHFSVTLSCMYSSSLQTLILLTMFKYVRK